jgi:hypothetical protein
MEGHAVMENIYVPSSLVEDALPMESNSFVPATEDLLELGYHQPLLRGLLAQKPETKTSLSIC